MTVMKWPLVTTFCSALVIASACLYTGERAGELATYRWRKPLTFESLRKSDWQLRSDLLILQAVAFSQIRLQSKKNTSHELQQEANYLSSIDNTPLKPVVDLQIASCYLEIARSDRSSGDATADHNRHTAEGILHSLGWNDVSDHAVSALAGQTLRKAAK